MAFCDLLGVPIERFALRMGTSMTHGIVTFILLAIVLGCMWTILTDPPDNSPDGMM